MRIVYCTDSICYAGGIQRITIAKANELAKNNEVWIIVTDNKKDPVLHLSPRVHLIDLNINYFEDDWKSKLHILKGIFIKRYQHKKCLSEILNQIQPDVVISTGTSEKNFLPEIAIKSHPIFIREIHSNKNYRLLSAKGIFDRILAYGGYFIDYKCCVRKYDKIIILTQEDKRTNWKRNDRVCVIPNPVTAIAKSVSFLTNHTIVTAGRFVYPKNFSSLISAWALVAKKHSDWILEIWGDGNQRLLLQDLINELELANNVFLKGYTYQVQEEMAKASGFVLSSTFEGFGLVITEAMSCGLPVVSYACPCGPKDIISEGVDGFLVPVNDEQGLADRICRLIENEEMRKAMGKAARLKAEQYRIEKIIPMWMDLFNQLLKEKREK